MKGTFNRYYFNFSVSNPLNDTEFDAALDQLQKQYNTAHSKNWNNFYKVYQPISFVKYKSNEKNMLNEWKRAKHRLYQDRAEAQVVAKRFSNGSDPLAVAVGELVRILERYEEEILEDNQRMHDDVAENMRNITDTVETSFYSFNQQLHEMDSLMIELNDTRNSMHAHSAHGHYHCGLASTFGTMFGMLITFILFIVFKKFKHRNDPVKYTLF